MRNALTAPLLVLALAVPLAACSKEEAAPQPTAGPKSTLAGVVTVDANLSPLKCTFDVEGSASPGPVTIWFSNAGAQPGRVALVAPDGTDVVLGDAAPGVNGSKEVTVVPGNYTARCTVGDQTAVSASGLTVA